MDKRLTILINEYFDLNKKDTKFYLNDFLERLNGENIKLQLSKDFVNNTKITNNDLFNIFKIKIDLYYTLHEKDIFFNDVINFFTNEDYFNREKYIFKPYEFLIKGKTFKYKDLYNILLSFDNNPDCYKFIDNLLIRVVSRMISEIEHMFGYHNLESLNLGIEDYNKYVSNVQDKLEIYKKMKVFLNKEDKSQFIKFYLDQIIDQINVKIYNSSDKTEEILSKRPINIKKVIELAKKYEIQINPIQIENYKQILNNVEQLKNIYLKCNLLLVENIIQNSKNNKEYEHILSNNNLIVVVDNILINIFKKYKNVFLEEKFKNIIFFKYTIESMIAIELNIDMINKNIINILKKRYVNIDDNLIFEIQNNSNLNDLYVFPIETQLAIHCGMDLIEFEKIISSEMHNDLRLNRYIFEISILKKIWPDTPYPNLIVDAKNIISEMNLPEKLFNEIFPSKTYEPKKSNQIIFHLKLYKYPLEALLAFSLNVDITNFEKIWFKINIPKNISRLNDIIHKYTDSVVINKSNFDSILKKIKKDFFKTDKYKNENMIIKIKLKKELLEYINSFEEISENDAISIINDILSENIFEYDIFQKIILYKYSLEALLCIKLNIPINDELFGKVNILPSINVLEKAKKETSFLSMINANLIKEINLFLSSFNKYPIKKFLKILNVKTTMITNEIRLNVKNEISKTILHSTKIEYKPSEQEVVSEILKLRFEIPKLIDEEIKRVNHLDLNLDKYLYQIKLRYNQLDTNIDFVEKRIASVKGKKDYSALLEEKIFNSKNYTLKATIIIFMCTDKNLIWFQSQRPEVKYKILCDIIDNGLDKIYVPEYVNDYSTFEPYLYNVFYKFVLNNIITVSIRKYNFNYKMPKVEFLQMPNLTDTIIEIVNNKPVVKRNIIIETKKIGENVIVLDNNTNILKYNDRIIFYNVDYLFAAEEDFIFLSNGKYYYDSLMYPMPNNMIINESSTKHVQYYIDEVSYFAKDIVPIYEYLFLKINHDVTKLNKDILQQYNYEINDFEINLKKRISREKYTQENVLELLKKGDFSKINYLYTYDNLNEETIIFLKSNLIVENENYIKSLKDIFKDLITHEESKFTEKLKYCERMNNVWHLETNHFFNVKDFCKDLEFILYTFYNKNYFDIINNFSNMLFEDTKQVIEHEIKPLFSLKEIELFQNYNNLVNYGVYSIEIEYNVGESSSKFQNLKDEYLNLCEIFIESLGYEEKININNVFNNISMFLRYLNLPQFITLEDKIIIETNNIDFENDMIKTVNVTGNRMDSFVNYIIQAIESKITISMNFFDVFYDSFEKYVKFKHKLIIIDVNPKANIGVIHKLFGLSLFSPIKFIPNEIDDLIKYEETLDQLYQALTVYTVNIKSLNSNILELLNENILKINKFKEIVKTVTDKKYCEKKIEKTIKKYYYFDPSEMINDYYKLEFKYTKNISILSNIIKKIKVMTSDISKFENLENIDVCSENEFVELLEKINSDIYNISDFNTEKLTIIQSKIITNLLNTIVSKLNHQQIIESEKSRLCRFILLYNEITIKEIKIKNYSIIRNKFFNRLIKKYIFLKEKNTNKRLNIYFKDCYQLLTKNELEILMKRENEVFLKNTHYETEMNNLIDNLSKNNL